MNDSFLNSSNASYVAELYFKFIDKPGSIHKSWSDFFNSLDNNKLEKISGIDHLLQLRWLGNLMLI